MLLLAAVLGACRGTIAERNPPGPRDTDTGAVDTDSPDDTGETGDTAACDTALPTTPDTAWADAACPSTCDGCCLPDGTCVPGDVDEACGDGSEYCAQCASVGLTCEDAFCVNDGRLNGMVADASVHVNSAVDATRLRGDLVQYVWRDAGFPHDVQPTLAESDVESPIDGLVGVAGIERLEIEMDLGFTSVAYLFFPESPRDRLVLFHQGHGYSLADYGGDRTVQFFLDRGYPVMALCMPLYEECTGPVDGHGDMWIEMDDEEHEQFRFFLEPVAVALNHAETVHGLGDFAMIGISGGGWTTTVYAAIDPRVRASFPVAGSLPLYLRDEAQDVGDIEQYDAPFYEIAGYLDLHVLGTLGGRRQLQLLNRYDDCCFAGTDYQDYESRVQAAIDTLGEGRFDVFLDESHDDHLISQHVLEAAVIHALEEDGVQIVDDIDPPYGAFEREGAWTLRVDRGFGGDTQYAEPGDAEATATWTFAVEPGTFRVSASWVDHPENATNAPFVVTGSAEVAVRVDQRKPPGDLEDSGASWKDLATLAADDTLTVTLADDADGLVLADAIRIERICD